VASPPQRKNVKRLYTDLFYSPTMAEWNWLLERIGRAYKSELRRRTMHESELFPVNSYIILGNLEDYLQMPQRIRSIEDKMAAQDILQNSLFLGTKRNFISLMALFVHYFAGRELLIELKDIDVASDLDDHLTVLDFWRRATVAMRTDGVLTNIDGNPADSSRVVDAATLERISDELIPVDSGVLKTTRELSAQLLSQCFLENCDSRIAVCDTGPYHLDDGTFIALRELCLDSGDFEWTTGIRDLIPHHNFVVAYCFDRKIKMENNIWGTAWFNPHDYLKHLKKVRFYIADSGSLQPLTIAELVPVTNAVKKAHRELYVRYAQMSRKERTFCATKLYAWKLKSWARAAGAIDEIDWDLSPRVMGMYEELSDNERALDLLGNVFVPPERDGVFRPIE
jgi:hypothetical protein